MQTLSNFAWAALDQFRQQAAVWDGDLVSKTGRSELIAVGLATRNGNGINSLTTEGRKLALRLSEEPMKRTPS